MLLSLLQIKGANVMDKPLIFVVDRNPAHNDLIRNALASRYSLIFFDNESSALEKAGESQLIPRLLILNFMQLKLQGFQFLDSIKAQWAKRSPIIFLLNKADPQNINQSIGLGANELIVMPATSEEICQRVDIQLQLIGLKSMLNVQQRISQENWAIMDRYMLFAFTNTSGKVTFISHALAVALGSVKHNFLSKKFEYIAQRHHGSAEFEAFFKTNEYCSIQKLKPEDAVEYSWTISDTTFDGQQNWYHLTVVPRFDDFRVFFRFRYVLSQHQ